jgi:hypothetical protein
MDTILFKEIKARLQAVYGDRLKGRRRCRVSRLLRGFQFGHHSLSTT